MQLFIRFETEGSFKTKSNDRVHTSVTKVHCDLQSDGSFKKVYFYKTDVYCTTVSLGLGEVLKSCF